MYATLIHFLIYINNLYYAKESKAVHPNTRNYWTDVCSRSEHDKARRAFSSEGSANRNRGVREFHQPGGQISRLPCNISERRPSWENFFADRRP